MHSHTFATHNCISFHSRDDRASSHPDAHVRQVDDPYMASYGVEDPEYAVAQLAQTTMRSELGQLKLDEVFKERQALNELIVAAINKVRASPAVHFK